MESNSFHYNSGDIYYEVTGAGEPVVFVHGFTLDHRMWQPQVEVLRDDYQMITYDVRGFGRSSLPDGPYNHAADLRALLYELADFLLSGNG